ncbi:STAS domain-containing protein [Streptomyces sp. NPDC088337]|uniref:STAS domain-containing protein n=1 Tax=unclassified Streptomyces TaxID=2593676 RepID=UPI002DD7ADE4|nr:STAS domain-containing protein [Streptomyces sp. NBC_01788]WSB25110.1 STAS domain-containing protein [Streptomyces sp. NBC_01788]
MSERPTGPADSHAECTVGTTTVVTLNGDVDLVTRLSLAARLDTLTDGPRPDLVLDLRPVPFIDCAGLGLLCRVRNRVTARGGRLRLVSGSSSFRRILRHTGLTGVFQVLPEFGESPGAGPIPRQGVVAAGPG